MRKQLVRMGNSVTLELDASELEMLGIDETTEVDVSIEDGAMVIRPISDDESFKQAAGNVIRRYEGLFRRLSR